jgi:membrane-bound lytic murein transglycosylase
MKKIMFSVVVIAIASVSMFAQTSKPPRKTPEERTEKIVVKMKSDLALSDDQVLKLKPVILKREQQREDLYTKMDTVKSHSKKIMQDAEQDFKKILTPDQLEKLKQERKEMHDKHLQKQEKIKQE